MSRKSGLGRGLGALIPTEYSDDGGQERTDVSQLEVPIAAVTPNPRQPRTHFDEESLAGLTASIAELGVLQPILVRRAGEGRYELIAGERRWRAAKRAGLQTIPVVVRDADTDSALLEQALVENLHRADLNAMEEAGAYQQLIEDFGLTQEQVATRVGKSRAAVSNTLRLFQLPPAIQALVADDELERGPRPRPVGHARSCLPGRLGPADRPRRSLGPRDGGGGARPGGSGSGIGTGWTFDDALDPVGTVSGHQAAGRARVPRAGEAARRPSGYARFHFWHGRKGSSGHRVRRSGRSRAHLPVDGRGLTLDVEAGPAVKLD